MTTEIVDVYAKIDDLLQADTELMDMLPLNAPFYDGSLSESSANSIVPFDQVEREMKTPFITLQEGTGTKIGRKLIDESFFIRCYNDLDKTTVELNKILNRIRIILDETQHELETGHIVKIRFESVLPPLRDQAYNKRFREARFRIFYLL